MNRYQKLNLFLIIVLAMGLVYISSELDTLQNRVDSIDSSIIQTTISIDNGTIRKNYTVQLTKGATALEALQRVSSVQTEYYSGMGKMITAMDGLKNNKTNGKYWFIGLKYENGRGWKSAMTSVDRLKLRSGDRLMFWYGKNSKSPFGEI